MTLSEFYSSLGESLDEVLERLRMESRIVKYLGLFLSDPNLGLNKLSASSSELTEDLRPGAFTANSPALLEKVESDYKAAVEGIKQLEQ